jgi:uncharacterized alpha/beta hydrolase family protein
MKKTFITLVIILAVAILSWNQPFFQNAHDNEEDYGLMSDKKNI